MVFFQIVKMMQVELRLHILEFSDYYQSQFSMDKLQSETAIEISYEFVFSNPLVLKPNVQYIINPGTNTSIPNALMALVRMSYSW